MNFFTRLEKLDRRWIFLAVGLLVLFPLLFPLALPLYVSAPVASFVKAVDSIPNGSKVLMSCDYDPSGIPEMVPMTRTALRHLLDKKCKVIITVLWNGGPGLVDRVVRGVVEKEYPDLTYGVDYVNLGYKAGDEAVMVLMGQGILNAFPRDYRGNDTRSMPIMKGVRDYSSFPMLVNISSGYPGTKEWVQQVQARFHIPMVAGVTAVSAPEYYPYLQSKQLLGLLGGMAGAAEYEKARGEKGSATRGMDAQSLAHFFVAFCILLGNVVLWSKTRGARVVSPASLATPEGFGVWVGALLTFCVFSFLYKDNPFYKLAEHLFVGVSAGYYIILNWWTVIYPNLYEPLRKAFSGQGVSAREGMFAAELGDYRGWLLIPALLGVLLFTRLFGKIGWLSRWSLAIIIGVYAGIQTTGFAQGDFVAQVQASLQPLWTGDVIISLSRVIFTIGLITSLLFFFFSREHKGALGVASRVGVFFLMVGFGAGYGYTVMSRVSLLIGRFQFLLEDWLGIVR